MRIARLYNNKQISRTIGIFIEERPSPHQQNRRLGHKIVVVPQNFYVDDQPYGSVCDVGCHKYVSQEQPGEIPRRWVPRDFKRAANTNEPSVQLCT